MSNIVQEFLNMNYVCQNLRDTNKNNKSFIGMLKSVSLSGFAYAMVLFYGIAVLVWSVRRLGHCLCWKYCVIFLHLNPPCWFHTSYTTLR